VGVGRQDEAARVLTQARSLLPWYYEPYLHLGKILDGKGMEEQAYYCYRSAIAFHPDSVPQDLLARTAEIEAKVAESRAKTRETLSKKLRANPADVGALGGLLLFELLETSVDVGAEPAEGIRRAIAAVGAAQEDLPTRIESQEKAVEDRPESVVDRAGLGILVLLGGDAERARTILDEALALSEADPAAMFGAALADLLTGAEGEERQRKAAMILKKLPVAWLALGASCLAHDKPSDAQTALKNALLFEPTVSEVSRLMASTLVKEDEKQARDAFLKAHERLRK
jgi:tetratricopeptide (TPR) repeat protein